MKSIIMFLVFLGSILIISGVYDEKIKIAESKKKIEYKFIPRTYYEEQLSNNNDISLNFESMFNHVSPWFDRTIGNLAEIDSKQHEGIDFTS